VSEMTPIWIEVFPILRLASRIASGFHELSHFGVRWRTVQFRVCPVALDFFGKPPQMTERRAHRPGTKADSFDAERSQFVNGRGAKTCQNIYRTIQIFDNALDRFRVGKSGGENAVGAGIAKSCETAYAFVITLVGFADLEKINIRARIQNERKIERCSRFADRANSLNV
jgi:hypothetical protein